FQLSSRYGEARPSPAARKISTVISGCLKEKANPAAAPKNGAEQDVASTVASNPLKNAPADPSFADSVPAAVAVPEPRVTSNTPNRFSAINVTSVVITTRK